MRRTRGPRGLEAVVQCWFFIICSKRGAMISIARKRKSSLLAFPRVPPMPLEVASVSDIAGLELESARNGSLPLTLILAP